MGGARRDAGRRRGPDPEGAAGALPLRILHPRRFRQIRAFLEGKAADAPTPEELEDFVDAVAGQIEGALARHAPIHDLLALLNAGRDQRQHLESGTAGESGAGPASGVPGPPLAARGDEDWMRAALREASAAEREGEVPVGAVIVRRGRAIGRGHNQRERLRDPTAHAEMIALTQAAEAAGTWRLDDAVMYVTLEPCPMCAGALVNGRMGRLVYGADDPKAGACGSLMDIVSDGRLNHRVPVTRGVLAAECGDLLRTFFRARRGGPRHGAEEE